MGDLVKKIPQYGSRDRGALEFKSHIHREEGDVMALARKPIVTATPTTSIKGAAELMVKHKVRRLPIVRSGTRKLQGMVRSRDIIDFLGGGEKNMIVSAKFKGNFYAAVNEPVESIMDKEVPHGDVYMSTTDVAKILLRTGFGGIPILDAEGQIEGIVSERDFISNIPVATGASVSYYMVRHMVTAEPELSIKEAAKRMVSRGVRRLPVVRGREIVGIVTTVDIMRHFGTGEVFERMRSQSTGDPLSGLIQDIMTRDVVKVGPEADVGEAAGLMKDKGCGGIPVVSDSEILGIITERDLLRLLV